MFHVSATGVTGADTSGDTDERHWWLPVVCYHHLPLINANFWLLLIDFFLSIDMSIICYSVII